MKLKDCPANEAATRRVISSLMLETARLDDLAGMDPWIVKTALVAIAALVDPAGPWADGPEVGFAARFAVRCARQHVERGTFGAPPPKLAPPTDPQAAARREAFTSTLFAAYGAVLEDAIKA